MQIPPFQLERYLAEHEFTAKFPLCLSDCESMTLGELLSYESGSEKTLLQLWLGYTESTGHPELRRQIASLYGAIQPNDVLVHAGAGEAIFLFLNTILAKGDHVIVQTPCYQSHTELPLGSGCEVSRWEARDQESWRYDLEDLGGLLRPETKLVIVTAPHNPTGYLMTASEQEALVSLLREREIYLFSDEVYRGLEYDEKDRLPAACDVYERAFSLGVMSKSYGLPGLRIGWVATRNESVLGKMAAFKDYTSICNSAPSELLALIALRHGEKILTRNREIIAANLDLLRKFFSDRSDTFSFTPPRAGCLALVKLKGHRSANAFCESILKSSGVLLAPGSLFGDPSDSFFRIGFGRKSVSAALQQLEHQSED